MQEVESRLSARIGEIEQRERQAREERDARIGTLQNDLTATRADVGNLRDVLESAHQDISVRDARVAALEVESNGKSAEIESTKQSLAAAQARIGELEGQLSARGAELDSTRQSLGRAEGSLGTALRKWEGDQQSLERIKDALAAALARVDEIEGRRLE